MPDKARRIRVLVSGKDYKMRIRWVNRWQLKRYTGEDIPLGTYTTNNKIFKNKVLI